MSPGKILTGGFPIAFLHFYFFKSKIMLILVLELDTAMSKEKKNTNIDQIKAAQKMLSDKRAVLKYLRGEKDLSSLKNQGIVLAKLK